MILNCTVIITEEKKNHKGNSYLLWVYGGVSTTLSEYKTSLSPLQTSKTIWGEIKGHITTPLSDLHPKIILNYLTFLGILIVSTAVEAIPLKPLFFFPFDPSELLYKLVHTNELTSLNMRGDNPSIFINTSSAFVLRDKAEGQDDSIIVNTRP